MSMFVLVACQCLASSDSKPTFLKMANAVINIRRPHRLDNFEFTILHSHSLFRFLSFLIIFIFILLLPCVMKINFVIFLMPFILILFFITHQAQISLLKTSMAVSSWFFVCWSVDDLLFTLGIANVYTPGIDNPFPRYVDIMIFSAPWGNAFIYPLSLQEFKTGVYKMFTTFKK